jgi:hypothetical protein
LVHWKSEWKENQTGHANTKQKFFDPQVGSASCQFSKAKHHPPGSVTKQQIIHQLN